MTAFPEIPDRDLALPTSTEAVRALLDATAACIEAPLHPAPVELLDLACAARHARRFKIDVSFALSLDGRPAARFSVNDKGEPGAFRARLLDRSGVLALPRERLEAFFALSPPGFVQTTVALKWAPGGGAPDTVSLYFEELALSPGGDRLVHAVLGPALGVTPPPWPGLLLPGYADSFTANAGGRTERVDAAFLARKLLDWGVFGWLLITPPVLPLKLAFLQGVRRNPPLAVFVLLWSALYLLSESSWGLNQGRHALIYAAPLLAVAAPVLVGWGSRRGLLILFVVLQLAAFGRIGAALVAPEQAAITALRARPPRSDTLILYARHGQDMDPLPLLEAAGVGDVLALDQVAPPGCAEGAALRRVGIRAQAVDLARKRGLGEAGLQRVVDLSRDLLALEAGPAAEEAAALRLQSDRLRSFANPRRCAEQAPAVEALLAPYSQVLLFVDPAPLDGRSAFEAFAARHLDSVVFPPEFNRWEPFELASAWIDVPELTRVPGLYAVRSIALPSVGAQLWAPPDPPIAR